MSSKRFGRHVRDSFQSLLRNRWMAFASIGAVTVTLILVGVFLSLLVNVNKVATDFENNVEIKVLISNEVAESKAIEMQQSILKLRHVDTVRYVTKEEEMKEIVTDFGSDLSLFDQENPLQNVIYVKAEIPSETASVAQQIQTIQGVDRVLYGKGQIDQVFEFVRIARLIGSLFIVGLVCMALFLISNTIKVTITARRHEIEIMKLVGATNHYVRMPFMIEGALLGIFGAIIPMIVMTWGYTQLYEQLMISLRGQGFTLLEPNAFLWKLNTMLLIMSMFIGLLGSGLSAHKFVRVK
ncbi:permease-like cell division protein FtsX [Kurthia senegalensis]|uniref:permease-like cell division protein FtsX n=1 Tax=Kurthia senegalensis TaxID=1033740 RepID=UPI000289A6BB|nr:permease-like cell division protein FtsX [Kurthia senegalensis]